MSNTTEPRQRFGRRALIAGATIVGVTIGAAGLAGAAQSAMHLNEPEVRAHIQSVIESNDLTDDNGTDTSVEATENSVDDNGGLVGGHGADDATENSVDDNGGLVGGHGADDATSTSVDDHGNGGHGADDATTTSVSAPAATVTTVDDHGKGGHGSDD